MDYATIIEFISTVGFPIACVVVLFLFIFRLQQESVKREEKLMTIITDYGNKLAEITATINAINDKIDRYHMGE